MKDEQKQNSVISNAFEIFMRLGFLFLLIALCFRFLSPFAGVILWGMILALAASPLYNSLNRRLGDKPKWSAVILILFGLILVFIPVWLFLESAIHGVEFFAENLKAGSLSIPPPSEKVAEWPLIGKEAYKLWEQASANLQEFISRYKHQIILVAGTFFEGILGVGGDIIQFLAAIIIAGILLATKGTEQAANKFFKKLVGDKAQDVIDLIQKTVGNVTRGIIGLAFIQAFLMGLGFVLAGVPYAGIWAIVAFILSLLSLPWAIIVIPVSMYLFSAINPLPAILWTIYLVLAGESHSILKPIIMGKGAPVPMLVIYLGVIGGFLAYGFIGMFTGAVIVSLGYKLFLYWLDNGNTKAEEKAIT